MTDPPSRPPRIPTLPQVRRRPRTEAFRVPPGFRPDRSAGPGRHRLLDVFRGFASTVPFRKYPGDDGGIRELARSTWAHIESGPGWMYVAPRRTPPEVRAAGFRMVESAEDVIVVSRSYLANGATTDLYLDIVHEFLHLVQRHQGRELWPGMKVPYVDRPTEIEAYAYAMAEARRLGASEAYLRRYLHVTWIRRSEYLRLLRHLGVRPPARPR